MNQKVPIGNMVVTFANSNATYVAIGMNANTYAYNTNATFLMNVHTVGDISTGISLRPDGRLRINTATDANRVFTVYNNDKMILSQDQSQLVSNANTVVTETLYTKGYAEGSGYIIANSGSITIDLNHGTNFFVDPRNETLSNLTIIKPSNFVANRNRSLSCMITVIDTATIANSFWTSAGVVWPYGIKPPNPVCAKLYSLLYSPNFPNNWFGFTSSKGANTGSSGLELSDGGIPVEPYWWMTIKNNSYAYYYGSEEFVEKAVFDENGNMYYFVDDLFELGNINTTSFTHSFAIGPDYTDENTEYRAMYSYDVFEPDGNTAIYLAGSKEDYGYAYACVDPGLEYYQQHGLEVACLTKYDKNGNVVWEKRDTHINICMNTPGSAFESVSVDSLGNAFCIGSYGYIDAPIPPANLKRGVFFAKHSSSGSVLYTQYFERTGSAIGSKYFTKFDDSDHLYMFDDTLTDVPTFLKIKNDGTIAWTKILNLPKNIFQSTESGLYASKSGTICFTYTQLSPTRYYVGVMNSSGAMLWSKLMPQSPESVIVDTQNNVFVCCNLSPNYTIIYKFNVAGTLLWQIRITGTLVGKNLSLDKSDNLYIIGHDNRSAPNDQMYVIKIPNGGNVTGSYSLGSATIAFDYSDYTVTSASLSVSDGSWISPGGLPSGWAYNQDDSYDTIKDVSADETIQHINLTAS